MSTDLEDKTGAVMSMLGATTPAGLNSAQQANYALMAANRVAGVAPDVSQEQQANGKGSFSIGFGGHKVLTVTRDEKGGETVSYNSQEPPAGHMNKALGQAERAQEAGIKYDPARVYEEKPTTFAVKAEVSNAQGCDTTGCRTEGVTRTSQINLGFR